MNYSTILDTIGNTPLIPIRRLNPHKNVVILAKMESFNPGGSIKDRIALWMIQQAEQRNELTKDKIVIEASSGNTGIGLAMVCAVKGYKCLIAMSEAASIERRKIMQAYGAEILLTPAALSTDGAIEEVYSRVRSNPERYFCTDQFNNPDNYLAHYYGTAPEIWEQTGGRVTCIVASMGTTGTLMGITRKMRELNPQVRTVGVEPYLGHRIQGLKNMKESYRPEIFDKHLPDAILNIHDDEAFELTRRLAREEGLFVGMSSGAALAGALREAASMEQGVIVVIFPDGGERYLSTELFKGPRQRKENMDHTRPLMLTNTLTREKEVFDPLKSGTAKIYSCGPTAYEYAHLGLCRRVILADLLRRVLQYHGYSVTHVMNITDIDDKTIDASLAQGEALKSLTDRYAEAFLDDVATLNVLPASCYPRASEHVQDMIDLAQRLIDAGYAYVKHGSVYFDISKLPSYGRLSRVDINRIQIGHTVDLDDYEKDSPVDFTLFKRVTLRELKNGIGYETPWGQARPGWHIECVAMSMKYLGDFFDIHTSGSDLIFPHHENEIAMAAALTQRPLARMWLHSELILVDGKKMSRSAGNVITLRDLLEKGYTGRQVRYYLMKTHYRKPIDFSFGHLDQAVKALRRLDNFVRDMRDRVPAEDLPGHECAGGCSNPNIDKNLQDFRLQFVNAVNDDLNLSMALGVLFSFIRKINYLLDETGGIEPGDAALILNALDDIDRVLGIMDQNNGMELGAEVQELVSQRENARKARDWKKADQIRQKLRSLGIEVMDTPGGVKLTRIKENSDQ